MFYFFWEKWRKASYKDTQNSVLNMKRMEQKENRLKCMKSRDEWGQWKLNSYVLSEGRLGIWL